MDKNVPDLKHRPSESAAGRRLALIAGVLGLVPAIGLGSLRMVLGEAPEVGVQLLGNLAFALVYAAPYLLILAVSRANDPATRGGLLLALALLSLAASFSTFSLVTIVLLPATAAVFVAAVRSIRSAERRLISAGPVFLAGLACAALIGLGFFALFGIEPDESHCWVLTRVVDEGMEWQGRPNVGGPHTLSTGLLGPESRRSFCTSDIITNSEAARSLGIVAAGAIVLIGVSMVHRRA